MPQINIRVTEDELKAFNAEKSKREKALHRATTWKEALEGGLKFAMRTTELAPIMSRGLTVEQREEVSEMIQTFFEKHVR